MFKNVFENLKKFFRETSCVFFFVLVKKIRPGRSNNTIESFDNSDELILFFFVLFDRWLFIYLSSLLFYLFSGTFKTKIILRHDCWLLLLLLSLLLVIAPLFCCNETFCNNSASLSLSTFHGVCVWKASLICFFFLHLHPPPSLLSWPVFPFLVSFLVHFLPRCCQSIQFSSFSSSFSLLISLSRHCVIFMFSFFVSFFVHFLLFSVALIFFAAAWCEHDLNCWLERGTDWVSEWDRKKGIFCSSAGQCQCCGLSVWLLTVYTWFFKFSKFRKFCHCNLAFYDSFFQ